MRAGVEDPVRRLVKGCINMIDSAFLGGVRRLHFGQGAGNERGDFLSRTDPADLSSRWSMIALLLWMTTLEMRVPGCRRTALAHEGHPDPPSSN